MQLAIPIVQSVSLAAVPAVLASLEGWKRVGGKSVITF